MSDVSLSEVNDFLSRHGETYLDVLSRVKRVLTDFARSSEGRHVVYRIATRGDYQHGQELKAAGSTVAKLFNRRKKYGQEYSLEDIEDFVGVTVICIYPSDVKRIAEWIRRRDSSGVDVKIPLRKRPGWPATDERKDEGGYRAHHFVLTLQDARYDPYRCELQVKTILHEGWSRKTHDVIYKSKYRLPEHEAQAEQFSKALSDLDATSEELRDAVEDIEEVEEGVKRAAQRILMLQLADQPTEAQSVQRLVKRVKANQDKLRRDSADDILTGIRSYVEGSGVDRGICMLAGALASLREERDLDQFALFYVGQLGRALEGEDLVQSLLDKATIYFCLGYMEDAREAVEEALRNSGASSMPVLTARCKHSLAYYLAELEREEERARTLASDAVEVLSRDNPRSPDCLAARDTLGYTEIVFGESKRQVKAGLKKCREALQLFPDREMADAFLRAHERIATRKLAMIEAKR